jgi:ABC-type transport system involved in multi-copper enzyme maturation permease subunit
MSSHAPNILLHLLRKESRQLVPLIAILASLALVFQFLGLINGDLSNRLGEVALLGMPSLFAVGAGALLVGQEKDQRTIHWLQSMPIPKAQVVRSKLLAALLSLVVVWLVSLVLYAMFLPLRNRSMDSQSFGDYPNAFNWPLNTLFLLLSGLGLAWRFKSSFTSLFAIIPLAMLPWFISESLAFAVRVFTDAKLEPNSVELALLNAGCLTIGAIVVAVVGWREGMRYLQATPAPIAAKSLLGTFVSPVKTVDWIARTPPAQGQALVRQFSKQNRVELLSIFAIMIAAVALGFYASYVEWRQPSIEPSVSFILSICAAALATSYLGVISFQGDQLQNRIRFLADRGVPPGLVWRTRHTVPIAMLVISGLLVFALVAIAPLQRSNHPEQGLVGKGLVASLACFVFLAVSVLIYSYSQWVGQLIRSPIVAAIVAPAFVGVMGMYWYFAFVELDASIWLLVLSGVIPMVATWAMMKRWMNGGSIMGYLLRQGAWFMACLALPAMPFFYGLAMQPSMPPELRTELESIAIQSGAQLNPIKIKTQAGRSYAATTNADADDRDKKVPSLREEQARVHHRITSQLEQGVRLDYWAYHQLLDHLLFERTLLDSNPNPQTQTRFREFFELALRGVESSRRSVELIDQGHADAAEVELLRQLQKPDTEKILGRDRYLHALRFLADTKGRDETRRRAVAVNWVRDGRSSNSKDGFRNYEWYYNQDFSLKRSVLSHRLLGVKVVHLLAILDAKDAAAVEAARAIVSADWNRLPAPDEPLYQDTMQYVRSNFSTPSALWRGRWEQQAVELLKTASEGKNE